MRPMKIALAQMSMSGDMDGNFRKSIDYMKAAEADLIFFPEIQLTPFFPQYLKAELKEKTGLDPEKLSMTPDDDRIQEICRICKEKKMYASPNFYIEENGRKYDMSLMIDNRGQIIGKSKMVHIYQAEGFYEVDYYSPSEEGFSVYDLPFGKVGVVICFDRHLPESIRTCAKMGAELVIIPTANTKSEPMEMFEWELRVQAFHNNVFIAMCNRTGLEGKMDFAGESIVIGPDGQVLCRAGDEEQLMLQAIDLDQVRESRERRPYINLRREEMYR